MQKAKPVEYQVKSNAMSMFIEAEIKEEVKAEPVIQIVEKIVQVKEERKWSNEITQGTQLIQIDI